MLYMLELCSFLWLNKRPFYDIPYFSYLVKSSADGHLDCFPLLAVVDICAADINIPVLSFWVTVFSSFGHISRSGTDRSFGNHI